MKKIKASVAVILCLVMLFSCFAVFGHATEPDPDECEHSYTRVSVAAKCAEEGYDLFTCSKCGDYYKFNFKPALGHIYGNWETVKEASCSEEGFMQRKCSRCEGYETKTVSVLEHVDTRADGKCDICGADVAVKVVISPFDWIKAFFKAMIEWFRGIFA